MKVLIKNQPTFFINKNFKTIQIKVLFPFKKDEKDIAMTEILPGMINISTKNYPTEKELSLALLKNYILSCFCFSNSFGNYSFFSFNCSIPDTYSYQEDMLEKQFQLFGETIYNPKIENNKFFEKELSREIESLKVNIEKVKKDNTSYAMIKLKELVDDNNILSSTIYNHMNQIDQINTSNLYDFYLNTVYNNQPAIYVFGNCDKEKISNLCDKYLYRKKFTNKEINLDTRFYLKPRNESQDITEKKEFRNSVIILSYKVKDMKKEDEIYLSTIKELMSSLSSRLLNKKIRDEHELVYSSFVANFNTFGLLNLVALINKDNKDLALTKMQEVLNDLKNEKEITPLLEKIKDRRRVGLIRLQDDKSALFQDSIINDLKTDKTHQEYYNELCKVTAHDINLFIDRLVLDTTYFLEEGKHE